MTPAPPNPVRTGTIFRPNPELRHPLKVSAFAGGVHTMQEMRDFVAKHSPDPRALPPAAAGASEATP